MATLLQKVLSGARALGKKAPAPSLSDAALSNDAAKRQGQAQLLLGIDFGTAFTKVVWRDFGGVRVGVAPVGADGASMAPSVVWVDGHGGLHLTDPGGGRVERLLKMRLASNDPEDGDPAEIAALSVFFVGSMLRTGFAAARAALRGADAALYGAALGCPAEYCDDQRLTIFQRVGAQAWRWAHDQNAPRTLGELRVWMADDPGAEAAELFEARAEVAAAVDCFTMRPDAEEGRYLFLDVGAGTLDGACFKLYREQSTVKVRVLSAAVAPLGVETAARDAAKLSRSDSQALMRQLFGKGQLDDAIWQPVRSRVGAFVGGLLMKARGIDCVADWLAAQDTRPAVWRSLEDQVELAHRLPVFFGGGGMTSPLYRLASRRAGEGLEHNYGIPRLALGELTPPPGFEGVRDAAFHRFAVAYGLTRPFTEAPPWILPSAAERAPPPFPRDSSRQAIDYADSKDVYG